MGRSEEIGLLFSRWEQVQDNDGQVVLISGEAGVGKSRVLQSLQSTATENSGTMVNFVCSNYRKDTPFHPIIDFLERILDAGIDSEPEEVLDRLDALL